MNGVICVMIRYVFKCGKNVLTFETKYTYIFFNYCNWKAK